MIMKYLFAAIGLLFTVNTYAIPYSLEGYTIDAYMERTIEVFSYPLGRINGYGLDAPFEVLQGDSDKKQYSSTFTLDVDKDRFTIDFMSMAGWQNGIVFNLVQPDYTTTTTAGFWSGLGTDTNIEGLGIDIGLGWVKIDFSNTHFTQDSYFIGYFNYQEVPESASFMLLILGLLGIYVKSYRRTKQ
jgi:hypothetical protein